MHPGFLIPEILSQILENLVCKPGHHNWGDNRKGLEGLAVACRDLSGPVLDVYWRTLPSIVPLIRLLPSDLWEVRRERETGVYKFPFDTEEDIKPIPIMSVFSIVRKPAFEDWDRLLKYNRRILYLKVQESYTFGVADHEAWQILTNECPGELLPNVHQITLPLAVPYIAKGIRSCALGFREKIQEITMTEDSFPEEEEFYLACRMVQDSCPNITSLHVRTPDNEYGEPWEMVYWEDFAYMIQGFGHLKKIRLDANTCAGLESVNHHPAFRSQSLPSTFPGLDHLSRLETLISIDLNSRHFLPSVFAHYFSGRSGSFPVLKELTLSQVPDYPGACVILRSFLDGRHPEQGLRKLGLEVSNVSELRKCSGLEGLLSLISGSILSQSLRDLDISAWAELDLLEFSLRQAPDNDEDIRNTFAHVLSLRNLQRFKYSGPLCNRLDNDWFERAARAWPKMQELNIQASHSTDNGPAANLEAYIRFVEHCQDLQTIDIPAVWKPFDAALLSPSRSARIKNITVVYLTIFGAQKDLESPMEVWLGLRELFPNLKYLDGANASRPGWWQLQTLLILNIFAVQRSLPLISSMAELEEIFQI